MRKTVRCITLAIAVTGAVVMTGGFIRSHADEGPVAAYVQPADIWQARQQLVWNDFTTLANAQVAEQERVQQAADAAQAADVALIQSGDQAAMLRESDREDQQIRSIILSCDPAVAMQLPAVTELAWPLSGPMMITSPYGERVHPIIGEVAFHRGVDLRAHYGSPILAPADGLVVYTGTKAEYGNMLVVLHGSGIATVYGHLWKFEVQPWQRVSKGEVLGYTGNTGFSTGPHLHFEVRQNGEATNPLEWLPPIETTEQGR